MRFNKKNLDLCRIAPRNSFEGSKTFQYEFLKNSAHIIEGINKIRPLFRFTEEQNVSDQMKILSEVCNDQMHLFDNDPYFMNYEFNEDKTGVDELTIVNHILEAETYQICLQDVYTIAPKWLKNIIVDFYAMISSEFVGLQSIIDQACEITYDVESDCLGSMTIEEFTKLKSELCSDISEIGLFCKACSVKIKRFKQKTKSKFGSYAYDMKKYHAFLKRIKIHTDRVRRLKKAKPYVTTLDLIYDIISLVYTNTVINNIEIDTFGVSNESGYDESISSRFYGLFDIKYDPFLDMITYEMRENGYEIGEAADIYKIDRDGFTYETNQFAKDLTELFERPIYDCTKKIDRHIQ